MKQKLTNILGAVTFEEKLFLGVVFCASLFAGYVYSLGLTANFVDQNAHLNIARQVFDSITPGVSQVGFWPPLLHVLMTPFAQVTPLFASGLAGAFTLIPILAVGSVYLFKLLFVLTRSKLTSIFGVALFIVNPYTLYYAATPMTEILFMTLLIATAYYVLVWMKEQSFSSLILLSLFIAAASLSRFEGFILLPVVGIIVIGTLLARNKKYAEIEGTLILFGVIAAVGVFITFLYGFIYAGDPLVFINGPWSAPSQQEYVLVPTQGNFGAALYYMYEAAKLLMSEFLVVTSFLAFTLLTILFLRDKRFVSFLSVMAVLISPFLFDVLALYQGSAVVYLAHLPPFDGYFNERYGLYLIAFVVVSITTFVAVFAEETLGKLWHVRTTVSLFLVFIISFSTLHFFVTTSFGEDRFSVVASSATKLRSDQLALAQFLTHNYDDGKILITRALQNFVTVNAGIPLQNYIMEGNYQYYDEAVLSPWFYARWIVTYNPNALYDEWRRNNEKISTAWVSDPLFNELYELVYINDTEHAYRLREDVLVSALYTFDIAQDIVPSLNAQFTSWNPIALGAHFEEQGLTEANMRVFLIGEGSASTQIITADI